MNNKGYRENNRGEKRAEEILDLFCKVSGKTKSDYVRKYLEKSNIYEEIQAGNEVFLYDSLAANLLEITCELRREYGDCYGSQYITADSISDYYKSQVMAEKIKVETKSLISTAWIKGENRRGIEECGMSCYTCTTFDCKKRPQNREMVTLR